MFRWMMVWVLFATLPVWAQEQAIRVTEVSKKGSPMIFLPHIGCSSAMWSAVATHYRDRYACYLVDFAGFDAMPPLAGPSYTAAYVQGLKQFIRTHKLNDVILVGQNYGAFVGATLMAEPDMPVRAMIASDFYPRLSMVLDPAMTQERLAQVTSSIRQGLMSADTATFRAQQQQLAEMMNFIRHDAAPVFVGWQLRSDRRTLAETLCEQFEGDLLPLLRNNTRPMLVCSTWYFARTYKNMPLSEAGAKLKEMYGDTPAVTHAVTEDAKDFIAIDQPEWFISQVDQFLRAHKLGK